ncbi:MAG: ribosomal protection-like ABC-F family protein [Phycisphaerales bacterium]
MPILTAANLRFRHGIRTILDGATLSVEPGEKIGLVGRNGSGKTTFMNLILGRMEPDEGSVQVQRGSRVGYLSQDPNFEPGQTLRESAASAFDELKALHRQMEELYEAMATADPAELERLMTAQAKIEGAIEAAGGYAVDHRIDAMLHGLGFSDEQFDLSVDKLSGGQKGRLGLARLLLEAPDLLLLDEPTNHLDIAGRQWLEEFLAEEYRGAVLVVSHDRWLLDRVVSRIVEVERGEIHEYPGNYAKYRELRLERQLNRSRVHEKQLDKIRAEEQYIRKYKAGQRAKQARGRESRLQRFKQNELVDRPIELSVMKLKLPPAPRSGDMVFAAEGIAKGYGDRTLFRELDFDMKRGERVGILGPNGTGKSTLIKCLLGELEPDAGKVRVGSRVSVGYYRQLHEHLDMSLMVWQYLQSVIVGLDGQARASEQQARDLAGAFLFSGPEQDKVLGDLSGGERGRAVLAGLVAGAHNLLVLDEPTNHLDIPSAERLEESLDASGGFDGSLLLISHDRALIERTCDRLLVLGEDLPTPRHFAGRYSEWLERQRRETAEAESAAAPPADAPRKQKGKGKGKGGAKDGSKGGGGPKPSGLAQLSTEDLERRIEKAEARIRAIDAELSTPEVYESPEACQRLGEERGKLVLELEPLEFEWAGRGDA